MAALSQFCSHSPYRAPKKTNCMAYCLLTNIDSKVQSAQNEYYTRQTIFTFKILKIGLSPTGDFSLVRRSLLRRSAVFPRTRGPPGDCFRSSPGVFFGHTLPQNVHHQPRPTTICVLVWSATFRVPAPPPFSPCTFFHWDHKENP